ncbi:MAG: PorP/SprF family type IX secretion system membrane protein [Bacteroidales bacterium]|nr:PorP/SprF family type IX secretion system membrane protein [Bacteroidales bacterium]
MTQIVEYISKKYFAVLLFSVLSILPAFSQFEAQISQYMFHTPTFNPASIAENKMINVSGQHRIQWVGIPGAPQTTYFTINAPLIISEKVSNGVGIKFLNDKIGAFSNQSAHLQYAFKRKFKKNTLSLGADIGFVSVSFLSDSIRNAEINSDFHDFLGDQAIPTADDTGMNLDLSLGAFYSAEKYYLGVSYVHLNAPSIKLNDERTHFNVRGVLYATGGYDFNFKDSKWKLRSSALAKSDFASWQAEVSSRVEYNQRYWGGLSYRFQDAVVFFAGLNVMSGLTIGYAYDLPAGKLLGPSTGSHEAFLSYSFMFDFGGKNKYKSIRIL